MKGIALTASILIGVIHCYALQDSTQIVEGRALLMKGKEAVSAKQYDTAVQHLENAIKLFNTSESNKDEINGYYALAEVHYLNYSDSLALASLVAGEELAKKADDKFQLSKFMTRHANYLYRLGHNQQSIVMRQDAIELARACGNIVGESYALSNMGLVLKDMGRYDESFKALYEALKIRENNKEFSRRDISSVLLNIGHVLDVLGRSEEAGGYYQSALKLKAADGDSLGMARVYSNIAVILKNKKEYQKALAYIDSSNYIIAKSGLEDEYYVNYTNMGTLYKRMGDPAKGELFYNKALAIAQKTQSVQYEGDTYLNLATLKFEQKAYGQSISYLQKALQLTAYTRSPLSKYEVYGSLSEAYAGAGRMNEAYKNLLLSNQYRDSVFKAEQLTAIEETKAVYETEKKEQQIALQQAELSERAAEIQQTYIIIAALVVTVVLLSIIFLLVRSRYRRNQQLMKREKELSVQEAFIMASIQSQENERKRFAQDLHDGMGQLISALRLSLLSVNKDSSIEQRVEVVNKAEGLLNDMHREIRSIAFNLMPQTLVQHGLVPALKEMADRINASGQIVVRIDSYEIPARLAEVQEISLYRIIQEWINNVVKYANAKLIEVQLVGHESELAITIEDNGRGFDIKVLESSAGNGWKNIMSRMNLVKGAIDVDSQPGRRGTTLVLRLPMEIPVRKSEAATMNTTM